MATAAPTPIRGSNAPSVATSALIRGAACILLVSAIPAAEPPAGLAKLAAERETASEEARSRYLYRQSVRIEEINAKGARAGEYREEREVIFSPAGERSEQVIGKPQSTLDRLRLTDEDFRDLREIQPMLLTRERLWLYKSVYRGEETVQGVPCWVLSVTPRQILDGQRLFSGLLWISQTDYSTIQSEGRAVPEILGTKQENLFPLFRTIRKRMENGYWFPSLTVADDTLPFRNGALRLRMRVEYSGYRKFGADSVIKFDESPSPPR